MDEFKKYLQQHREEMDVEEPSGQLLQRIQMQTAGIKKAAMHTLLFRYAAAACIIFVIAFGLQRLMRPNDKKQQDTAGAGKTLPVNTARGIVKDVPPADSIPVTAITSKHERNFSKAGLPVKKQSLPYQLMNSFEHNYSQLVNLQLKNIRNTPVYGEAPDYFDGFKKTFVQIDSDEQSIKKHIKTSGLNDALLEQLINVYQEKLNVLKNLQHEINKMNKKLKDNQQPSDTLTGHYINI